MADFDPDAFFGKLPTSTPTKGAKGDDFDPDAFFGPVGGTSSPSEPAPKEGSSALGAGAKQFVEAAPATLGFIAGGTAAAAAMAPTALAAGATTGPAAPLVAGGIEFLSFMVGGMSASGMISAAQDKLTKMFAPDYHAQRQVERQQHPDATLAGDLLSAAVGFSPKTAAEVAGKVWTKPLVQRGVGATLMGGMDVAQQAVGDQPFSAKQAIGATITGAALPSLNVLGKRAAAAGERIGGRKAVGEPSPADKLDKLPPDATPEMRAERVSELQRRSKERDAKAPLEQTAFRDKDGNIIKSGPKHSEEMKLDPTLEQGFVTERDQFLTREEAIDQAKRAGQLPEDFVAKAPEGERQGLHSGDMREAGIKEFDVTKEQPAGVPKKKPVKDKLVPTWEELQSLVSQEKNMGGAIDRLLEHAVGTPEERAALQVLNESAFIRDADLKLSKDFLKFGTSKAAGIYRGGAGKHEVELGKQGGLTDFIHEAFHAGTQHLLAEGKSAAAKKLIELHKQFVELHAPAYEAKLAQFKLDNPNHLLKDLRAFKDQNQPQGFDNVHEFVSEALSNKEFRKLLTDVKSEGTGGVISNLWKDLKNAIYDGLGIPKESRTALDDVLEHTEALIKESSGLTRDKLGKLTVASPNKFSQWVHDRLEKDGIAVAHSSPHKFGKFNWLKHALTGEGAMAFGSGTYLSRGEGTNKYYERMAKEKAVEKFLDAPENSNLKGKADAIDTRIREAEYQLNKLEDDFNRKRPRYEDLVQDLEQLRQIKSYHENKPTKAEGEFTDPWEPQPPSDAEIRAKEELAAELGTQLDELGEQIDGETSRKMAAETEHRALITSLYDKVKIPTYHSTFKAKVEELLDWNATKQSDLVNSAFKKLGIDPVGDIKSAVEKLSTEEKQKLDVTSPNKWYGDIETDGFIGVTVNGKDYSISTSQEYVPGTTKESAWYWTSIAPRRGGQGYNTLAKARDAIQKKVWEAELEVSDKPRSGGQLYKQLSEKLEPKGNDRGNMTSEEVAKVREASASIALAEQGVVGNVHDAQRGTETEYRNYVAFDDTRIEQNFVELASKIKGEPSKVEEHLTKEAPEVVKEIDKIDPRSMPNKEAMLEHATDLYEKYGEEQALKFIEDFNKDQSQRSIPVRGKLEDVLHKIKTFMTADSSEFNTWYREAKKQGVSKEQTREWFDMRERGEELPPEGKAVHEAYDKEQKALYDKAVAMDLPVGPEYKSGQSRVRLYDTRDVTKNFKDMVKEFFSDKSPMTEKMAEQADSAIERKVYQLDDGRVIEIHRIQEDAKVPMKDKDGKTTFRNVRKGTEVWEWNNGKKKMIGHTEDLNFKMGDKIKVIGKDGKGIGEQTMVDGKVGDIETHSPYRYLHDSMASQALAIMGLRKMVREAELLTTLKNNADFKKVAHSPDQPIETIPKGWKTPESIEKIPQLRGYHFDPKTAAIIEDFARVYDPTILSKMTAALVKNMMLNPIPHMFNEAMHLFNARGFTGWVNPVRGLEFVRTARKAWNDVGNQTQVYRDAMKAGGSMLGADPRNKMFDAIIKENSKEMFKQPEMQRSLGQLAKKLGTTVGDLYNGISNKSQQAMWFTRDVMYMQLLHETMARSDKSTGGKMSVEEGVAKVERHLPNYRMPEKVLGSRGLSKALQNPNIAVFSRYHYGMLKSIANTLKDINPKNLKTLEGRKDFREGVDSILAISVAMAVLYPLMDKLAQAITGDDEAEMRRAGPYHLYHAGEQVIKGEKDLSALVYPIFTFNPMLLTLGQALYNKNLFSGKEIYHPQDPVGDQLTDAAKYFVKQVPQAPGLMGVGGGDSQATTSYIAKQLDVKSKTDKQREAERTARKRAAAQAKGRATRREKGTL